MFVAATIESVAFSALPIMIFAFGSYFLMITFVNDIKQNEFRILSAKMPNGKHMEMNELMCSLMRIFSEFKQLSGNLAERECLY